MTTKRTTPTRRVLRLLLIALTFGVVVLAWRRSAERQPAHVEARQPVPLPPVPEVPATRPYGVRRFAVASVLTVLFFAGASLSAIAGDNVAALFDGDSTAVASADEAVATTETVAEALATGEPATEAEPALAGDLGDAQPAAEPAAVEAAPAPEPAPVEAAQPVETPAAAAPEAPAPVESVPASEPEPAPAPAHGVPAPAVEANTSVPAGDAPVARRVNRAKTAAPAVKPAAAPAPVTPLREIAPQPLDPEAHQDGMVATVWLNRSLPDPTPPSLRLSPAVAKRLLTQSRQSGARWELVLGLLRADGSRSAPARGRSIDDAALSLAGAGLDREGWALALNAVGRTAAADRALALAHYYRAVGMKSLVDGLLAQQDALAEKVLNDERVTIYEGGRADIAAGHVDVRVLATIEYLAESFGSVTVSCLVSGHRLYARPGVVSRHIYGEAVDIAALGGIPIAGHQEPGGITEEAVREILLLPAEVLPRQVISLLGLGGPSFPLADHGDHIHIGF